MPVNYQQIRKAIKDAGLAMPQRERELLARRDQLFQLFGQFAGQPTLLRERANQALAANPDLRLALPPDQALDSRISEDLNQPAVTMWAADGSQIIPDAHLAVQFGVINVGLIRLAAQEPPRQQIESKLLYANELYSAQGHLLGEESIALRRDSSERTALLKAAQGETSPVLTLTDGPLELFREMGNSMEYKQQVTEYLSILSQMAEKRIATAGYVDKPRSDLVIRLLELQNIPAQDLGKSDRLRSLVGIADTELFASFLQPGERSIVFELKSPSAQYFGGDLAIHFFYLNVGRTAKAHIVRVEIPAWMAGSESTLATIQHALLAQCRQMGSKAYPYILHRAHETAVVSYDERNQLLNLLQVELLNQGLSAGETSQKQQAKNLPGKTRFGQ